jgi:prepilin-type N-terminal cleavage/methylation domain-containing protein
MISHRRYPRARAAGFTLIEILVTLLLMALVLPPVMRGISAAAGAGSAARHRTEGAGLASSQLATVVAGGLWHTTNLSGDFSPDWPNYHWQATVTPWGADTSGMGLQQIDLAVTWQERGRQQSLKLSTLAYTRGQQDQ